ncbi:MAG TPA: beta-ketoacyl synthase N-terminal-like domain-containing protein, partial [Micavibrio sp.]
MRRVVVTGMGMVTPLGLGVDHNWVRITAGDSGIRKVDEFDVSDMSSQVAGLVPKSTDENPPAGVLNFEKFIPAKELRRLDRFIAFGMVAAHEAVEDSGWKPQTDEERERTGVMIGSGIGGLQTLYESAITLKESGPRRISPFFLPGLLINLASGQVSIKYGFKGPNHAV